MARPCSDQAGRLRLFLSAQPPSQKRINAWLQRHLRAIFQRSPPPSGKSGAIVMPNELIRNLLENLDSHEPK